MSPNQYCSLLQMHQITSLASHVSLWWTQIGQNVCICTCLRLIRYLSAMLATSLPILDHPNSHATYAKKSCPLDYYWSVQRYMRPMVPQGVHGREHMYLRKSYIKQRLMACPNFSSSFFDSTISEHTNPFSILSPSSSIIADSRIGDSIEMLSPVANTRTSNPKRLQTHKLTVIVTNCRSLVNKKAELINLLDSTKAGIAICTETWPNSTISDSEICPDNYSLFRNDRTDRHEGGVAILTSNKFIASQPVEYMCNNSELLWVDIQLVGCKKLMIGSKSNQKSNHFILSR